MEDAVDGLSLLPPGNYSGSRIAAAPIGKSVLLQAPCLSLSSGTAAVFPAAQVHKKHVLGALLGAGIDAGLITSLHQVEGGNKGFVVSFAATSLGDAAYFKLLLMKEGILVSWTSSLGISSSGVFTPAEVDDGVAESSDQESLFFDFSVHQNLQDLIASDISEALMQHGAKVIDVMKPYVLEVGDQSLETKYVVATISPKELVTDGTLPRIISFQGREVAWSTKNELTQFSDLVVGLPEEPDELPPIQQRMDATDAWAVDMYNHVLTTAQLKSRLVAVSLPAVLQWLAFKCEEPGLTPLR
jgi:hypothetical protein